MAGHRPTSCAPHSLGSQISSADPEGSVLGAYGSVSSVKVLPDGHISAHQRTFPVFDIQIRPTQLFLRPLPHKYSSATHAHPLKPTQKCTIVVCGVFFWLWMRTRVRTSPNGAERPRRVTRRVNHPAGPASVISEYMQ